MKEVVTERGPSTVTVMVTLTRDSRLRSTVTVDGLTVPSQTYLCMLLLHGCVIANGSSSQCEHLKLDALDDLNSFRFLSSKSLLAGSHRGPLESS